MSTSARRLYVATAGTSLFGNLAKAAAGLDPWLPQEAALAFQSALPNPDLWSQTDRGDKSGDSAEMDNTVDLFESLAADPSLKEQLLAALPDFSTRGASAETASLFAEGAPHPSIGDHIILATSDNLAGLQSATAVSFLLGGRVRIGTASSGETIEESLVDAGSGLHEDAGVDVTVLRIKDLDTARPDDFLSASSSLGRLISWAHRTAHDDLILHLTGGYKVTIPLVLAIASHLGADGADVQAWANHDRSPCGIRLPLMRNGIDIDLRVDLNAASQRHQPPDGRWENYAYEIGDDGFWQLTPLGQALYMMTA